MSAVRSTSRSLAARPAALEDRGAHRRRDHAGHPRPRPGSRRRARRRPAPRQCRDALERGRDRRVHAVARDESDGAVADPRHPARGDARRAQRDRPPLRAVHAGTRRGAGCVGGRGSRRGGPRRPGGAAARPGGAGGGGVRPRPCGGPRRPRQDRRHRHRSSVRRGEHRSPAGGRVRRSHAAGLCATARSRGVSVHATVQLRRAARMGTRQAVRHRPPGARGRRAASPVQRRSTPAISRT